MNFEKELIDRGISPKHINFLKNKKVETSSEYMYYMAEDERYNKRHHDGSFVREIKIIPTEKIVGFNSFRGSNNKSLWEHYTGKEGDIKRSRIERQLSIWDQSGIKAYKESFMEEDFHVQLECITDLDKYYITSGGNHRLMMAKIVQAPFIAADVYYNKLVEEKKIEFNELKEIKGQINDYLETLNLKLDEDILSWGDHYITGFINRPGYDAIEKREYLEEVKVYLERFVHELVTINKMEKKSHFVKILSSLITKNKSRKDPIRLHIKELTEKGWSPNGN